MEIKAVFRARNREHWRAWLEENHETAREIWLISDERLKDTTVSYLDSVEEAICFGWIDGIAKRYSDHEKAQRFTPRRPRSNWTELNKERARRLIRLGLMTDAGASILPDLDKPFSAATDILEEIRSERRTRENFEKFPALYVRVRLGYIEEARRNPEVFRSRLRNFLKKTAEGKMFGNWNDNGRLS